MKKLTLEVDALAVESFATGNSAEVRGTVRGHDTRVTEFCNTRSCAYTRCCATAVEDEAPPSPAKPDEPFE